MTAAGPPDPGLAAWHRRFPDRLHLAVGSVRLWHAELPVRPAEDPSLLARWAERAAALGGDVARRLGLPEAVVAGLRGRPARRTFAFLDLPSGPMPVPPLPAPSPGSPEPVSVDDVPPAVLRPPGVDVVPRSGDWRTVPVVRAERVAVVAVGRRDGIEVYVADAEWRIGESPTWRLPNDAHLAFSDPARWTIHSST